MRAKVQEPNLIIKMQDPTDEEIHHVPHHSDKPLTARVPKVSIGLPVYNGERYLRAAVDSILQQDYTDFELIISDNASKDGTAAICQAYAKRDSRVRYSRVDVNRGAAPNYNRVFQLAKGEYFKWAAHDDVCLPGFLSCCVAAFESMPKSVVLVYPRTERIDGEGIVTGVDLESLACNDLRPHRRAAQVMRNANLAWAQFGLIRAETLRKTSLIGSFIGSDYILLCELAMLGELRELPEILFQRRVHPGMSNVVHTTRDQWLAFLDSSQTGRRTLLPPLFEFGWELMKSVKRMPLKGMEKGQCLLWVPGVWYLRNLRNVAGLCKRRIMRALDLRCFLKDHRLE